VVERRRAVVVVVVVVWPATMTPTSLGSL